MKNFTFKKNVLLSATAMGLVLAASANAAINVQTGTTDITAEVINAVVNSAEYAITATEPDKASYTYTAPDGSQADLNTTQDAADYKADSAATAYEGVSANADTVNYNDANKTAADYTYVSYDADGNTSNVSGDTSVSVLEKGFTSSELAGSSTVTAKSDGSTGIDIASYKVSSGENVYTIQKDASTGEYTLYENGQETDSYAGIKSELVAAYEADVASFAALQDELAGYYNDSVSNYNDVATVVTADNNKIADLNTWESGYETANTNYGNDSAEYNTQSATYDNSLSKVIDTKAKTAADNAVSGLQTAIGDMNQLIEAGSNTLVDGVLTNKEAIDSYKESNDAAVASKVAQTEFDSYKETNDAAVASKVAQTDFDSYKETNDAAVASKVAQTDFDSYKETNDAAVASKVEQTEFDSYKETNDAAVASKVAQTDFDSYKETNDAAVASKVAQTEFDSYKETNDAAVAAKVEQTEFDSYKETNDAAVASKVAQTEFDTIIGKINHLADDVAVADGKMNLDQGSSVSTHLRTLASSIGDRTQYTHEYNISSNESVATSVDKLDTAIGDLTSTGVNGASVAEQIKTLSGNATATQAGNEARFNRIENKIDDLQDEMREGLASTAALAGLVPLDNTYKTQLSIAMGGYKDKQAAALGAFHYLTDNIILNAGAAYNGSSNIAYKVGVTVGF